MEKTPKEIMRLYDTIKTIVAQYEGNKNYVIENWDKGNRGLVEWTDVWVDKC